MELLTIKDKLIEVTENINSNTTIDDVVEKMLLIYKIEKGLMQIEQGNVIQHSDLKKQVLEWKG